MKSHNSGIFCLNKVFIFMRQIITESGIREINKILFKEEEIEIVDEKEENTEA